MRVQNTRPRGPRGEARSAAAAADRVGRRAGDRRGLEAGAGVRREVPLTVFGNTMLIYAQHYAAFQEGRVPEPTPTYVAGFKQWLSLNRAVVKGQSGYAILAPVTARFASSNPADPDSWRRLARGEKPGCGEAVRSKLVGLKPAYVWDISQTDGEPIPEHPTPDPAARAGTGGAVGRAGRPDHRARLRAAAGLERRSDRRRQRTDRLHRPARSRCAWTWTTPPRSRRSPTSLATSCSTAPDDSRRGPAPRDRRSRGRVRRPDGRRRPWSGDRRLHHPVRRLVGQQRARQDTGRGRPVDRRTGPRSRRDDPRPARHPPGRRRQPARARPRGTRRWARRTRRGAGRPPTRPRCWDDEHAQLSRSLPSRRPLDHARSGRDAAGRGHGRQPTATSTVTLDREPYSADGALQRDDLQRLVDGIASDLGTPVRVEVHEADGSTFTDIITPRASSSRRPSAAGPAHRRSPRRSGSPAAGSRPARRSRSASSSPGSRRRRRHRTASPSAGGARGPPQRRPGRTHLGRCRRQSRAQHESRAGRASTTSWSTSASSSSPPPRSSPRSSGWPGPSPPGCPERRNRRLGWAAGFRVLNHPGDPAGALGAQGLVAVGLLAGPRADGRRRRRERAAVVAAHRLAQAQRRPHDPRRLAGVATGRDVRTVASRKALLRTRPDAPTVARPARAIRRRLPARPVPRPARCGPRSRTRSCSSARPAPARACTSSSTRSSTPPAR